MDKNIAEKGLRRLAPEGKTLYAIMRHVSRTGLTRHVSIVGIGDESPMPFQLNGYISEYLGIPLTMPGGMTALKVGGCGFDAGDQIVRRLSRKLYGQENALNFYWL